MPLYKTFSGKDKQTIPPRKWTLVSFRGFREIPIPTPRWAIVGVLLRVEYPSSGSPTVLRGRFSRWPETPREDITGFDDKHSFPGQNRHHYWSHFLKGSEDLILGFTVWHDGSRPLVLDGRQFKWTSFS